MFCPSCKQTVPFRDGKCPICGGICEPEDMTDEERKALVKKKAPKKAKASK